MIAQYPAREVKRGLDALYRKVEKHLCEEENLLQVVWRAMQEEFIAQHRALQVPNYLPTVNACSALNRRAARRFTDNAGRGGLREPPNELCVVREQLIGQSHSSLYELRMFHKISETALAMSMFTR